MKKLLQLIFLSLPIAAAAQAPGMNQQDMQRMMESARKMQECMRNIDQAAMESMASKAQVIEGKIKSLCQAGKRDEAQNLAIGFGREMAADEEMKKMQQCGQMMQGMGPATNLPSEQELKKRHICDGY